MTRPVFLHCRQVGLRSHYIAACAAAPLLIETAATAQPSATPCIINVGSFGGVSYVFNVAYGVGKAGVDRLAKDMAIELRPKGVASLSLWPGETNSGGRTKWGKERVLSWSDLAGCFGRIGLV